MSFDEFVQPGAASGESFDLNPLIGSLLVFQVKELVDHVQTVHTLPGEKTPCVQADVYVLDGPHAGTERVDALVFPRGLQRQLRPHLGKKVLGRVRKGQAASGKSAPWELAPATEADLAAAQQWASRRTMVSATPAANSTPPF